MPSENKNSEHRGLPRSKDGSVRLVATREIDLAEIASIFDEKRKKVEVLSPKLRLLNDSCRAVVLMEDRVLVGVDILDDNTILIKDPGHPDAGLFKIVVQAILDSS